MRKNFYELPPTSWKKKVSINCPENLLVKFVREFLRISSQILIHHHGTQYRSACRGSVSSSMYWLRAVQRGGGDLDSRRWAFKVCRSSHEFYSTIFFHVVSSILTPRTFAKQNTRFGAIAHYSVLLLFIPCSFFCLSLI